MDWLMPLLTDTDSIGHILSVYSVVIALGVNFVLFFGIDLYVLCSGEFALADPMATLRTGRYSK